MQPAFPSASRLAAVAAVAAVVVVAVVVAVPAAVPATAQESDPDETRPVELVARPLAGAPSIPSRRAEEPPVAPNDNAFDYEIGRQDLLEIRVFDVPELDQTVRVADDGSITMPLLGRLEVAGLTKRELERTIESRLSERYVQDPQVTVFVKEYESKKVAVSGAVREPGTYEMLGRKTLLEMISMAGGLEGELGQYIVIFRPDAAGGTERIQVDLEALVYRADPTVNRPVRPGDIIYVPEVEKIRIFVSGAVKNPNLYEVPRNEPVTVLKAITLAGGTTDRAADKRIKIMRTDPDGTPATLEVNLRRIRQGKAEDPILQPDDIVLVPEAFF